MPPDHIILYCLLAAVVVLLVTEWIPLEATALLTMGILALTGLVPAEDALAGFSSPAVITVWAVFILSGALDRTGVAGQIGRGLKRMAGRTEIGLTTTLMLGAGVMSAVMNNVAVAALLLPVTMDLARANHIPPSRLLLPLAYGSLLGGLTTMIGTPPNILVSTALKEAGLDPFGLFDFTPVGIVILLAGTAFMVFGGRLLLPRRDVAAAAARSGDDLPGQYHLQERTFALTLPFDNPLVGMTLTDSRLGAATGLYVVAVIRGEQTIVAPSPDYALRAGDRLFVQGRLERLYDIQALVNLIVAEKSIDLKWFAGKGLVLAEISLPEGSDLVGRPLSDATIGDREVRLLAMRREEDLRYDPAPDTTLKTGDRFLVYGNSRAIDALQLESGRYRLSESQETLNLQAEYRLNERLVSLHLVENSDLADISLEVPRLEELLGLRVLSIWRPDAQAETVGGAELAAGDRVFAIDVAGSLTGLYGLADLRVDTDVSPTDLLSSGQIALAEAVLAPRSGLVGKTLRQLRFRDKYGLGILAIWRAGRAYRTFLRDFELQFGDALLLLGPLDRLRALAGNPDLIVLSGSLQEPRRKEKAGLASLVIVATLAPVLIGLVPVHLAVIIGSASMIVTRCLTMEEAYRAIEWRAVFLIAGLLPMGSALERSGIASEVASRVADLAGSYGPLALLAGLVLLTFAGTCIIPTAALVLLMAPIALNTAAAAGLSPHSLLMAIAMASSASFLTPIAHPANILVMGPGGYRFRDYIFVGLPLTVVVFVVIIVMVPLVWPLMP
ncbi:MAG TPA: SLC13 family permease [Desulfuromonadales bacterium]